MAGVADEGCGFSVISVSVVSSMAAIEAALPVHALRGAAALKLAANITRGGYPAAANQG